MQTSKTTAIRDRQSYLRLHILANDNGASSQCKKLLARNAVNRLLAPKLRHCKSRDEAVAVATMLLKQTEAVASRASGQRAKASIQTDSFPDRRYGRLFFPAGEYLALTVTLGNGRGHNWWCVIYPPLCYANGQSIIINWLKRLFG